MVKNHLKRIATPRTWPILRKERKYVTRSKAGKLQELSLPISVVLREVLKLCSITREVKLLLNKKELLVDGKAQTSHRFPLGIFEVLTIKSDNKHFRLVLGKNGQLKVIEIPASEKDVRVVQVTRKTTLKKATLQLGFLNGKTLRVSNADSYGIGDSILMKSDNSVVKHLPLAVGQYVAFVGGRHIGNHGLVESLHENSIIVQMANGKVETLKKYAVVVGTKKPEITIE